MSVRNYVSYDNAVAITNQIATRLNQLAGAFIIKGSSATIPTLSEQLPGYVYNITAEFTTTADFVEGAGKVYPAGTDIFVADLSTYDAVTPEAGDDPSEKGWYELVNNKYVPSTDVEVASGKIYYEKTEDIKWDVAVGFIDVAGINARIDNVRAMISNVAFDETQAYEIGDVVTYEDGLYKFKAAHTANDPWDAEEVDEVDVLDLISAVEPDELTSAQVNSLIGLLS